MTTIIVQFACAARPPVQTVSEHYTLSHLEIYTDYVQTTHPRVKIDSHHIAMQRHVFQFGYWSGNEFEILK